MRGHLHNAVRRPEWPEGHARAPLCTFTVLVPRNYNPDEKGIRRRVELSKLVRTFRELRRLFTGYSVQNTKGWYRDRETGEEVRDRHFRVDVDLLVTPEIAESLREWKHILELRFDQAEIYMRLSERLFRL
jgi:hypothetical protein